jgi:hypothetical protein
MDIRSFFTSQFFNQTTPPPTLKTNNSTSKPLHPDHQPIAQHVSHATHQPAPLKGPDSAERPTAATGRPKGDHRTAEEIINANPTLQNLEMSDSIYRQGPEHRPLPDAYKQGIYKHTGDWTVANKDPESRANAAYNAARLFNFIDSRDAHAAFASQHNDGFLSGFSGSEQLVPYQKLNPYEKSQPPFRAPSIRPDSEHALIAKFIEHGYSSLEFKGEQQIHQRPTHATGRPRGDQRSAEDIIKDNPLFVAADNIVNSFVLDGDSLQNLQKHTGDWTKNNKDPEARADAAYNLAYIANYIDHLSITPTTVDPQNPNFNNGNVWHKGNPSFAKPALLELVLLNGHKELINPPPHFYSSHANLAFD